MALEKQRFTGKEMSVLRKAKYANPYWWRAMVSAAEVMPSRAEKYSGTIDPYTNFIEVAKILGCKVRDVFIHYVAIKLARAKVSDGDFEDESFMDSLRDLANYAMLWFGWIWREKNGVLTDRSDYHIDD
jgi:hypothetical protein